MPAELWLLAASYSCKPTADILREREMGLAVSSYDKGTSELTTTVKALEQNELSTEKDYDFLVSRQYSSPPDTTKHSLNYFHCTSESSIYSNILPGHVELTGVLEHGGLPSDGTLQGCPRGLLAFDGYKQAFEQEEDALKSCPAGTTKKFSREKIDDEMMTQSFRGLTVNMFDTDKKRFPALTVCKKPRRVKSAMFNALRSVVPSLKRANSMKTDSNKKHKVKIMSATAKIYAVSDSGLNCDEVPVEYLLASVSPARNDPSQEKAVCFLEQEIPSDSLSTLALFDNNSEIFQRGEDVLSHVEESEIL